MRTFRFIERIDKRLDQFLFHKDIDQVQLSLKKYLFSANIITFSVVAVYNLITIHEDLGLLREYGYALMALNFSFAVVFYWLRKGAEIFAFTHLLLTIILTTVFSIFCGGTTESGGIIFVGSTVIVVSIILKNYRWSVALFILFIAFTVLAIYLQPILVPEPQLSSYINQKMFNINFLVVSTFIFIFSIYLISLLTRKEKEENERQRELNETKSRLYTNITHEFRTPLTVILGMAKSLRQNIYEDAQKKLSLIESNGESLLSLVEQMLKLSKLQSRNLSVKNTQADIIIFLKCILQSFEFQAKQRSIELNFISNVDKVEMDFDAEIIKTIVSNLLSNAIKFTDNHGFILLKTSTVDDQLVIEIKDTGIGIPDDQQKRIFDRFYQLQSQHTRNYGGVGIGLALTKELIDLLQGSIKLQSREGAGSTFTVMLPIQKNSSIIPYSGEEFQKKLDDTSTNAMLKQPAYAQPLKAEKEDISNNLVLIVEDNDDVIYYLRPCLPRKF